MNAEEFQTLRKRLGWSMYEMARQLQVSRSTVWSWEHGQARPDPYREATLKQLRQRLDAQEVKRQREQFIEAVTGLAVGGGIGALLAFLFKENTDANSEHESEKP